MSSAEQQDVKSQDLNYANDLDLWSSVAAFSTDKIFNSKNELITWARETGKNIGYVIVIVSSSSGDDGKKARLRLGCERGGTYRTPKKLINIEARRRKGTGTKKNGCPFKLQGVKLETNDDWEVKIQCGYHNHPPAENLEGHAFTGRLSKEENTILLDMTKNMVKPRNILVTIKAKDKKNTTTMKTIYNARHKHKMLEKAGRSQMQQLMKRLGDFGYVEWHRRNESTDCVRDLFWAHPFSIDILNAFPLVLLMDCTYKTNRYGLPLLEIVGVTCTDLTFSVAFVYMEAEREDNYTWAMEKLKTLMISSTMPSVIVTDRDLAFMKSVKKVFPETTNLLCRFHITKN
ncbi:unnamed protein product, partial [Cuscuta epithymum]